MQPPPRAGLVELLPSLNCLCFPEKTGTCHLQSLDVHRASAGQERCQRSTHFQRSSALVHLGSINRAGGLLSPFSRWDQGGSRLSLSQNLLGLEET